MHLSGPFGKTFFKILPLIYQQLITIYITIVLFVALNYQNQLNNQVDHCPNRIDILGKSCEHLSKEDGKQHFKKTIRNFTCSGLKQKSTKLIK